MCKRLFLITQTLVFLLWPCLRPAGADDALICDVECSYFEEPQDPDDIFRLVTLKIPIIVHSDSAELVQDALDHGNGLEGCELGNCRPLPPAGTVAFKGFNTRGGCDPIPPTSSPSNPGDTGVAATIRYCTRKLASDERPDLTVRFESCFPRLVVKVENKGLGDAAASTLHGELLATIPVPRDFKTPAIAAGDSFTFDFGFLPEFCSSGCQLTMFADSKDNVLESDETNNHTTMTCKK